MLVSRVQFGFKQQTHEWIAQAAIAEYLRQNKETPLGSLLLPAGNTAKCILSAGQLDDRCYEDPQYYLKGRHHYVDVDANPKGASVSKNWQAFERQFTEKKIRKMLPPSTPLSLEGLTGENTYTGLKLATDSAAKFLARLLWLPSETDEQRQKRENLTTKALERLGDGFHLLADAHVPAHTTRFQPKLGRLSVHRFSECLANEGLSSKMPYQVQIKPQEAVSDLNTFLSGIVSESYGRNANIVKILSPAFDVLQDSRRTITKKKGRRGKRMVFHVNSRPNESFSTSLERVTPQLKSLMTARAEKAIASTVQYLNHINARLERRVARGTASS